MNSTNTIMCVMRVTSMQSKGFFFFFLLIFLFWHSIYCHHFSSLKSHTANLRKRVKMGPLKLSSTTTTLLLVLLIFHLLLVSADHTRTQVNFAMDHAATGGNQAVELHQRARRINHGSYRGPRKHLVNPTVADVYTVPQSSV